MKVFFSASGKNILKHQKEYKKIREAIKSSGHTLTRDWLEQTLRQAKGKNNSFPIMHTEMIPAVLAADIMVLDATVKSAAIGFQLALALEKEKPVLLLSQEPQKKLNKLFADVLDNNLLAIKSYDDSNAAEIVAGFLAGTDRRAKVRFNLVMDKKHDNYIEWAAYHRDRSKTEVIKKAIDGSMASDKEYRKYLLRD